MSRKYSNLSAPSTHKPSRPIAFGLPVNTADPIIMELFQMHTYCRPAGSNAEAAFNKRYLDCIPGMTVDAKGNRILTIPNSDGTKSKVLWSSHTDTVHRKSGAQRVTYGAGILSLSETSKDSACLGADCTAGVWLMVQMIRRNIPGLYIFHASEEVGGIGSNYIATKTPGLLDGIDYAIAFDRRGYSSVITHQGSRCASKAFAEAMARQLSDTGHIFELDDGGTFTDTANYTDLVSECTNLSVGYFGAHTNGEYLDVTFLVYLLERVCQLDFTTIPAERDPSVYEDYSWWRGYTSSTATRSTYSSRFDRDSAYHAVQEMEDLVYNNSYAVAMMLDELGVSVDEVAAYVANVKTH